MFSALWVGGGYEWLAGSGQEELSKAPCLWSGSLFGNDDQTEVTLTVLLPLAMLLLAVQKPQKPQRRPRAPRIRVPNSERAVFTADDRSFVGVIQRLSLSGGSAVLAKGPIPHGTMGTMSLGTVFGKVSAQIEFLQTGADGVPLAQAFRFLAMDDASAKRFAAAAKQMEKEGFSDADSGSASHSGRASHALGQLLHSVRRLAATLTSGR